jgi:hypothetical protein
LWVINFNSSLICSIYFLYPFKNQVIFNFVTLMATEKGL